MGPRLRGDDSLRRSRTISHPRGDAVAADIDAGLRRRAALDNLTHMMISILNIASVFFLLSR
jgi:hypothetical protein